MRIPEIENIETSVVIMAGDEPLSYIIPFFPKRTRFVSIKNNFIGPNTETLLHDRIREILQHSDRIYLLYKAKSRENFDGILKFYDLKMIKGDSIQLYTKFDDDLSLIRVARSNVVQGPFESLSPKAQGEPSLHLSSPFVRIP